MQLELKHLAPYLPYGLECNVVGCDGNTYKDCLLTEASTKDSYESFCFLYKDEMIAEVSMVHIENIKPVLRPLSDLLKDVEFSSDKVLEMDDLEYDFTDVQIDMLNENKLHSQVCWVVFQRLIENHFDVFGLIKQGLAIDINTLKNN